MGSVPCSQIQLQSKAVATQDLHQFGFRRSGIHTTADNGHFIIIQRYIFRLEHSSGVAGSGKDSAPVGVTSEPGSLTEHRIGDRFSTTAGICFTCGTGDFHSDHFRGSFPIHDHILCQILHNHHQCLAEELFPLSGGDLHAGGSVGKDQAGIIGTHIVIHRDPVEGFIHCILQPVSEGHIIDRSICCDVTQHSGMGFCQKHPRSDHTRAFGHTAHGNAFAFILERNCGCFRTGIRGNDRFRCGMSALCRKLIRRHVDPGSDFLHRQLNTDSAGGTHKYIFRLNPEAGSRFFRHPDRTLISGQSGTGIGNTAVDHYRTDGVAFCAPFPAELHRSSGEEIAGKGTGKVAGQFRKQHGEIRLSALFKSAGNTGRLKAGGAGYAAVFYKIRHKINLFVHHFT